MTTDCAMITLVLIVYGARENCLLYCDCADSEMIHYVSTVTPNFTH